MPTILVVDDAAFMRMRSATLLREMGHDVLEAGDGDAAVAAYRAGRPDAVLLDITMPGMDGLTALRSILAVDPTARVAMVTGLGKQDVVLEAIKSGASDFVVKPFDPDRLRAALKKLIPDATFSRGSAGEVASGPETRPD